MTGGGKNLIFWPFIIIIFTSLPENVALQYLYVYLSKKNNFIFLIQNKDANLS